MKKEKRSITEILREFPYSIKLARFGENSSQSHKSPCHLQASLSINYCFIQLLHAGNRIQYARFHA